LSSDGHPREARRRHSNGHSYEHSRARLDVVIGLGSNLGDRLLHLQDAVRALAETFEVCARSSVYDTAPVGPPQPDYLNAAVRVSSPLGAHDILGVLLAIEREGGRVRKDDTRWEARTIDLDILWIGGLVVATPSLTVPHARLTERAFALLPLLDVAPDAIDPRTGALFEGAVYGMRDGMRESPGIRRTSLAL
jgi:2-amino-4-hydroxy-6-hydroxymethyldihydropteridine diphosphokinase